MTQNRSERNGGIRVDRGSDAAEWAAFASRGRSRPLAAIAVPEREPLSFVADELIVDEADSEVTARLVRDYGAQLVPWAKLPPPPTGLRGPHRPLRSLMPIPSLLRFPAPPPLSRAGAELVREGLGPDVSATSEMGAAILTLAAEFASLGHPIGVNAVGVESALPLTSAVEGLGDLPFSWPEYQRANVPSAWQLVEAFRTLRPFEPVSVGILDGGFWLDGWTPFIPPGQAASDFGPFVRQCNLLDEGVPAGGANPGKGQVPWHGNAVASVASAMVGNNLGTAGVGGTVSVPVFFKTDRSIFQVLRCLALCVQWGIDVLNMSFSITWWEAAFPATAWNKFFQYAADHGIILVAAAGNRSTRLPEDDNPRPATRTPGTVTVGALDPSDERADFSNYGSSIDIWAPGVAIHTAPDDNYPNGKLRHGTSFAAPMVSGVAAMMRAVNPHIDTFQVNRLLASSGSKGKGRVHVRLNAYAAVLAAMGGRLPDESGSQNDSPSTPGMLFPIGPAGALAPLEIPFHPGQAVLADPFDDDWYSFQLYQYSTVAVDVRYYNLLGYVGVNVHPDDGDSRAAGELTVASEPGRWMVSGILPPGGYKLHLRGSTNLYELQVGLTPAPLQPDKFEPNEDFAHATHFRLRKPGSPPPGLQDPIDILEWGAGTYDLTLPPGDADFFRVRVDSAGNPIFFGSCWIAKTDAPVTIRVFDAKQVLQKELKDVRSAEFLLPDNAVTFVQVSTAGQSRYQMTLGFQIDPAALPTPLQEKPVFIIPDLLGPVIQIEDITHFGVVLPRSRKARRPIAFAALDGEAFRTDLLDSSGALVREGRAISDGMHERVELATENLPAGIYYLRLTPIASGDDRTAPKLRVERVPGRLA